MCGIFGYIGKKDSLPYLIEGLKKLEYRGYDSAGVVTLDAGRIFIQKCAGKISDLEQSLMEEPLKGRVGLGHTRWATHGIPSTENSHPHTDCTGQIAVIHNGIIENYASLKKELIKEGHVFRSATDTEVLAHLIEKYYQGNIEEAVRTALKRVEGSYAIGVICQGKEDRLVVARRGSPLIVGVGEEEYFISSDIPAILKYTGKVIYLDDGEMGVITREGIAVETLQGKVVGKRVDLVSWDPGMAEKGGYAHFMLKEIHEQPRAIRDTIAGRISRDEGEVYLEELKLTVPQIKKINRVVFTACGTSWHAGLVGEYLIEQFVKIPAEVEYAAEFRYREAVVDDKTLIVAISQSGETADTLAAVREARRGGARIVSICNVLGSSIARESHGVIYTHAGPEIGVASTKAFTTQLAIIYLMAIYFGRVKGTIPKKAAQRMLSELLEIPDKLERLLNREKEVQDISERFYRATNALYLGRGEGFPIALEGALKLKEVSYIHAEGYPAAEMKHGPIALIDKNMPVIVLALKGRRYEKILGNIEEVKSRGGIVIALASEGDQEIAEKVDEVLYIPQTSEALSPILAVVPLQLLAYHIAVKRGCHVDQPRHLAKSVTVE